MPFDSLRVACRVSCLVESKQRPLLSALSLMPGQFVQMCWQRLGQFFLNLLEVPTDVQEGWPGTNTAMWLQSGGGLHPRSGERRKCGQVGGFSTAPPMRAASVCSEVEGSSVGLATNGGGGFAPPPLLRSSLSGGSDNEYCGEVFSRITGRPHSAP